MLNYRSLLLLGAVAVGTWRPIVRIGEPTPLGRLDVWAIHGMSHSRVDGVDPLQVALTGAVVISACLSVRWAGAGVVARRAAVVLLGVVLARIAGQAPLGVQPDLGLFGLLLLIVAVGPLPGRLRGAPGPDPGELRPQRAQAEGLVERPVKPEGARIRQDRVV